MMGTWVRFRWLGTAGIELNINGQTLAVDPFFTRFRFWRMRTSRVQPDAELIERTMARCDHVLITHAHWDHVMDVPEVLRNTGAIAHGSPNACQLLMICGVPQDQAQLIAAGDRFPLGAIQIEVRKAVHKPTPGFSSGSLPAGLQPPLGARDYRMDNCFSFLMTSSGLKLLTDPGAEPGDATAADILFVYPGMDAPYYKALLRRVQPRLVIPIHWDNFMRPLYEPLRPFWKPPRWAWPPLQRVDLREFEAMIGWVSPAARVFLPQVLERYDLADML